MRVRGVVVAVPLALPFLLFFSNLYVSVSLSGSGTRTHEALRRCSDAAPVVLRRCSDAAPRAVVNRRSTLIGPLRSCSAPAPLLLRCRSDAAPQVLHDTGGHMGASVHRPRRHVAHESIGPALSKAGHTANLTGARVVARVPRTQ